MQNVAWNVVRDEDQGEPAPLQREAVPRGSGRAEVVEATPLNLRTHPVLAGLIEYG